MRPLIRWMGIIVLNLLTMTMALAAGSVRLDKGWEFRWGDDGSGEPPAWALEPVGSPGWQAKDGAPTNPEGRNGAKVLWVRTTLPSGDWTDPGLYIPGADQIFEVYFEGKKIYSFGKRTKEGKILFAGFPFHNIWLPADSGGKTLAIRFFSDHVNIGSVGFPEIGSRSQTQVDVLKRDIDRFVMGIMLFLLGIFMMFLYLRRRDERSYLTFAAMSLSMGLYIAMRTEMKYFFSDAAVTFFLLELAGFYAGPACICLFVTEIFGPGPKKLTLYSGRLLLGFGALLLVLALTGIMSPLATLLPFQVAFFICLPFGFIPPIQALLRRDTEAFIFLAGLGTMFLFGVFDVLMAMGVVPRISQATVHWGAVAFTLSMATILGRRFVQMHNRIARLKTALETILAGTKEMAAVHEKLGAAAKASHYILGNMSLTPTPEVRLTLLQKSSEGVPATVAVATLVSQGNLVEAPHAELIPLSQLDDQGWKRALEADSTFVDARKVLHVPLVWGEKRIGALSLEHYLQENVDLEEAHFADTLASSLSLALENIDFLADTAEKARLEGEIRAAEVVQATLLPRVVSVPNVQIESHYKAASNVGGDWYGYHYDEKGRRLFFFIGDVTGHGIPSALLAGVVCGAVYSGEKRIDMAQEDFVVSTEKRLEDMARTVNDIVFHTGRHADRLMTMLFLALHVDTGELHVLNAGHNNPFQLQVQTSVKAKTIVGTGNRLGYTTEFKYSLKKIQLDPNDIVFLYTDGLIENSGPDMELLSLRTLKNLLESTADVGSLKESILQEGARTWKDTPPNDDVTLLFVKWLGKGQVAVPA